MRESDGATRKLPVPPVVPKVGSVSGPRVTARNLGAYGGPPTKPPHTALYFVSPEFRAVLTPQAITVLRYMPLLYDKFMEANWGGYYVPGEHPEIHLGPGPTSPLMLQHEAVHALQDQPGGIVYGSAADRAMWNRFVRMNPNVYRQMRNVGITPQQIGGYSPAVWGSEGQAYYFQAYPYTSGIPSAWSGMSRWFSPPMGVGMPRPTPPVPSLRNLAPLGGSPWLRSQDR